MSLHKTYSPSDKCDLLQREDNLKQRSPHVSNGVQENAPLKLPSPPKSPAQDVFNSTEHSIATLTNIDVAMQPREVEEPKPRKVRAPKSVPDQKPNDGLNQKPPVSKRTPKHEPTAPQHSPHKLGQDLSAEQVRRVSNGPVLQSPSSNIAAVSPDRLRPSAELLSPDADMEKEEDTLKLLQEAAMNAPSPASGGPSQVYYLQQEDSGAAEQPKSPSAHADVHDIKDDTITLLKEAADHKHIGEVHVSCCQFNQAFILVVLQLSGLYINFLTSLPKLASSC